jgi:hypothetical protein
VLGSPSAIGLGDRFLHGARSLSRRPDTLHGVRLADTTPDIRRRQIDLYRAMSPPRRIELALTMSEEVRGVTLDGIRSRNPTFDEAQVNLELLRILHGARLASIITASHPTR